MLDVNLLSFIGFIIFVFLLLLYERKKVKRDGIVFMRRTSRGRNTIDNITNISPRFWRVLGSIGIIVSMGAMIFGLFIIFSNGYMILTAQSDQGVGIVLPGPVSTTTNLPGVFVFPWWFWVVGIVVVMVPHEFFHGIMARASKIRIKSIGWLFLAIIPGAFVEPDDSQVKKQPRAVKLRIYAAGSFANLITAMIVVAILVSMAPVFSSSTHPAGVFFSASENSSLAGLSGAITAVDGQPVRNRSALVSAITDRPAGTSVMITYVNSSNVNSYSRFEGLPFLVFESKFVEVTKEAAFFSEEGRSMLGITVADQVYETSLNPLAVEFIRLFSILFVFTLGIGIVNLLPIKPLDGGLMFEELLPKARWKPYVVRTVSIIVLMVLIFNIVGPFVV